MDCFMVHSLWQSVSWAGDQSEQLRDRVHKVEDLGDEEEEHGLAEVAEDGNHCKRHVSLPLPILIMHYMYNHTAFKMSP